MTSKNERQQLCAFRYENARYPDNGQKRGILEAATGFGKTRVGINKIIKINEEFPDKTISVVVPRVNLKTDWEKFGGHIDTWNLKNVKVYVVNSYVKLIMLQCNFLLLDECHRYAGEDSVLFSTVVDITNFEECLALTATLSDKERSFMEKKGFVVFDKISDEEAEKEGWIAPSIVFNLGITLNTEEREKYDSIESRFQFYSAKFNHNYELAQACRTFNSKPILIKEWQGMRLHQTKTAERWKYDWATEMGWQGEENHDWSPKKISEYAQFYGKAMEERRRFLYTHYTKLLICKEIVERIPKKTLVFSESSEFATALDKILPSSRAYHSYVPSEIRDGGVAIALSEKIKSGKLFKTLYRGIKTQKLFSYEEIRKLRPQAKRIGQPKILKENLEAFENGEVNVLSTVKKVDEGLNVESVELVVKASYTTSQRQTIQRDGRSKRIDIDNPNKRALIINLFIKNTQEERVWLKKSQQHNRRIVNVESVNDIISFLANPFVEKPVSLMFDNSKV
jgi:superfamily II DNA or RNA helicase